MCTEHLLTNRDKGKQINYSMLVFGNQKAQNTCPENNKACRLMQINFKYAKKYIYCNRNVARNKNEQH